MEEKIRGDGDVAAPIFTVTLVSAHRTTPDTPRMSCPSGTSVFVHKVGIGPDGHPPFL